jgi:hypothetical protein
MALSLSTSGMSNSRIMITREDYLNALELIDLYHQQLNLSDIRRSSLSERKLVSDWLNEQTEPIPARVIEAITCGYSLRDNGSDYRAFTYMDEINKRAFLRCRNVGKKAWIDFCKLAGRNTTN